MNYNETAVAGLLAKCGRALNASDRDGVMELYAADGGVMLQNSPSSPGSKAVRNGYAAVSSKGDGEWKDRALSFLDDESAR